MKITSVECYLGDKDLGGFVTVKVNTGEGISGFGEAGLACGKCSRAAFGQCQDFARIVLGVDPFNTEEIWEHLHRHTFWGMGGGVVVTPVMAAIDTACWDIKGKALNMLVYKLIGGRANKKLRAYASQLQFGWRTLIEKNGALTLFYDPKDYYNVVKDAMAEGYDAIGIDPIFAPLEKWSMAEVMATQGNQIRGCYREHNLTRSVERIAAAREAGGPDLDITVEIHSLLDTNTTVLLGQVLEPYRIMYYEEPTMPYSPGVLKHVKERCKLPLAIGERGCACWGFHQFFEDRMLDIIQPDLCNTGDITETKKICGIVQVYDVGVQIYVCGGPIAAAAALQVEAAIPNFVIHEEHNVNLLKIFEESGKYYHAPVNGFYEVPELPGIGQEMSEQAMTTACKVMIE